MSTAIIDTQPVLDFPPPHDTTGTPIPMMHVICNSVGMPFRYYTEDCRDNDHIELRFIAVMLIEKYFNRPIKRISLTQIGRLFGNQDHTTILNAKWKGTLYLEQESQPFTDKYRAAEEAVLEWISKQDKDNNIL